MLHFRGIFRIWKKGMGIQFAFFLFFFIEFQQKLTKHTKYIDWKFFLIFLAASRRVSSRELISTHALSRSIPEKNERLLVV